MAIAPSIELTSRSRQYIAAAYSDSERLCLVLNLHLDLDLPPLEGDFSLVSEQGNSTHLLSLEPTQWNNQTVLMCVLEQELSSTAPYKLCYRPTQWLMCCDDSGDSIEAFEEAIYLSEIDTLDPELRLKANFDTNPIVGEAHVATNDANIDTANVTVAFASEFRIRLHFDIELNTSIPPNLNEFRAELHDRWLHVTSAKYIKPKDNVGTDVELELSEPMAEGGTVLVAYRSAHRRLKTFSGEPIEGFDVKAEVRSQPYIVGDNDEPTNDPITPDLAAKDPLENSEFVADSATHVELPESDDTSTQDDEQEFVSVAHEQEQEILEPEQSHAAVTASEAEASLNDIVETTELVAKPDLSDAPEEFDTFESSDVAQEELSSDEAIIAEHHEFNETSDDDESYEARVDRDSVDTDISTDEIPSDEIVNTGEASTAPRDIDLDAKLSSAPSATQPTKRAPLSLTAKIVYLVPITVFCWLLFVLCIYIATIVFGLDLSLPSFGSSSATTNNAPAQVVAPVAKREPCTTNASDGSRYEGECVNGLRDGRGVYVWASGNRYEGEWLNGKRHGEGQLTYSSGAVYKGNFFEGREQGRGTMSWPNGAHYEGEYKQGRFHGKGIYHSAQGNRYEGVFENGSMTQNGACTMSNGERHAGPCRAN